MKHTRRSFLKTIGAAAAAGAAGLPGSGISAADRPNIVFIFCDDLGWADLPANGHKSVLAHGGWTVRGDLKMPNVDRLAHEGTMVSQFYVAAAVCSPSRTGIMTGRFPSELGIHDYISNSRLNRERGMPDFVDPASPTLTRSLQQSGYAVAHYGKWHLGGGNNYPQPVEYGIDEYDDCLGGPQKRVGSTEMIADKTIGFIEAHRDEPFFINAWLYDPHSPLHPTEEMMVPYDDLSPNWGDNKGALQVWYGVLTNLDTHVGRILDTLDRLGLSENTIVVFSSDNGPESGLMSFTSHYGGASSTNTGPFRGIKRSLYEGGIREPFIIRWPGTTPAGEVDYDTVIGGADLMPTFLGLAGVAMPSGDGFDGEDMSRVFRGETVARQTPLMWENRFPVYGHVIHKSPMLAIREGRWKLLMNPDRSRVELFDIPSDPTELDNVAEHHPDIVERLAAQVLAWQKTLPPGPVDADAGSNAYPWPGR